MDALPAAISDHLEEIRALCERYRVTKLTLFGSAARGAFDPKRSDVDLVVEFEWHPDPIERGRRYNDLWDELRAIFGRHVDLLVASTIKDPYLAASIESAHRQLYAA